MTSQRLLKYGRSAIGQHGTIAFLHLGILRQCSALRRIADQLKPPGCQIRAFPGKIESGGYFHAGANMIQASFWEEASMGCRSHTRKTCAPVWSQRLKLGPPGRKLRTNTV